MSLVKPLYVAEPLPDDPGMYGVRNTVLGLRLARAGGGDARWRSHAHARQDAAQLGIGQPAELCADPLPTPGPDLPRDLVDQIRTRVAAIPSPGHAELYGSVVNAVLAQHRAIRIYDDCGHLHEDGEPGTHMLDEVGVICEAGFRYTVCEACCTNDYGQHQVCVEEHDPTRDPARCWPCSTVLAMALSLGLLNGVY